MLSVSFSSQPWSWKSILHENHINELEPLVKTLTVTFSFVHRPFEQSV